MLSFNVNSCPRDEQKLPFDSIIIEHLLYHYIQSHPEIMLQMIVEMIANHQNYHQSNYMHATLLTTQIRSLQALEPMQGTHQQL